MGVRKLLPDGKTRGDYVWEDYISVFNRVRDVASGLKSLGFERVRTFHVLGRPFCFLEVLLDSCIRCYMFHSTCPFTLD